MNTLDYYLNTYLRSRPLFLSLIRSKEAYLFQGYLPLKHPVLDVGCGDGFFAKITFGDRGLSRIKNGFSQIDVGLDVSGSRVEEARKLGIYKKIVVYNGGKMPFPNNSFATVVSNCVLEHIPNLSFTLKEIQRVLKPGGLFLTTVMAAPWEEYLFGNLLLGDWYKKWMRRKQGHYHLCAHKEWKKLFTKAGFSTISCEGYLSKTSSRLIDIAHYLSIPLLISYKLMGKWVPIPAYTSLYPTTMLLRLLTTPTTPSTSAAMFFALQKPTTSR